jgi:hypothetical protein
MVITILMQTHAARSVAVSASVLKLLGPAMVGKAGDELLWCRGDGQPLRPPTTTHWFGAAVKRCQAADTKFPRVTVHELRHTAASLMIASRANVETVQSQLGRKTATMTLDQYGHLFPDDLDDVANKMDDLVSGCAQNVPTREAGQGENTPWPASILGGAAGNRTRRPTRQYAYLPADSLRLVPLQSRSLPVVSFSDLDGVKSGHLPPRAAGFISARGPGDQKAVGVIEASRISVGRGQACAPRVDTALPGG